MSLRPFRVGVSSAIFEGGSPLDLDRVGLEGLRDPRFRWETISSTGRVLEPSDLRDFDAVVVEGIDVRQSSVVEADGLRLVARFGAGFDSVDLDACTDRGIVVTNAPDGVRRPMATVYLSLLLALSLGLVRRDRLMRAGQWDAARAVDGIGLQGRKLGVVGLGSIGTELLRLAAPLGMEHLAVDRSATAEEAAAVGAELVSFEDVVANSDFLCICVPLTEATHHLIDETALRRMKPDAFVINAARGRIVDQQALVAAIRSGRLRGAALDVFETEPVDPRDPILALDEVILTPHALGETDECLRLTGQSVARSILAIASDEVPEHVVNPAVLDRPSRRPEGANVDPSN